jgi:hypothetical protein
MVLRTAAYYRWRIFRLQERTRQREGIGFSDFLSLTSMRPVAQARQTKGKP